MTLIHISADGENTFCGKKATTQNSSSLGMSCTCADCYKAAEKIKLMDTNKQ